MRLSSGSNLIAAVGFVFGLAVAMPDARAQDEETAAPSDPIAIEIIGEPEDSRYTDTAEPLTERPAKTADDPAAMELAPAGFPAAAAASTGGAGGIDPGLGTADPQEKVDPFVGSFSTAVPIAVPPFHGIEPNLALTYNSSRGNGFVGIGWQLSGLSVIERASPGKGAPRQDANDIFLLDGQELVACDVGTISPSCDTGGTHATKIESYLRIKQDTVANTWEITGRDGTKTTYSAVMGPDTAVELDTYRWAMTSVVDTHNNTVTYTWWCDGTPAVECYPDTITYNSNTVQFHRESRTDPVTFATGSLLGRIDHRLKSVDVRVASDRARAYALTYVATAVTAQSQLQDVVQYGTDAVLDTGGAVTSGTALPPMQSTYLPEGTGAFTELFANMVMTTGNYGAWTNRTWLSGDVSGDGRTDICMGFDYNNNGWVDCSLSAGDGSFSPPVATQVMTTGNYSAWANREWHLSDVSGDGQPDACMSFDYDGSGWVDCALSAGDGTFLSVMATRITTTGNYANWTNRAWHIVDVSGDGQADACLTFDYNGSGWITCALSQGDGSFAPQAEVPVMTSGDYTNNWTNKAWRVADVSGDGRADACMGFDYQGSGWVSCALSDGDGTFAPAVSAAVMVSGDYTNNWTNKSWQVSDVNGDGKADACMGFDYQNNGWFSCALSEGDGTFTTMPADRVMTTGNYGSWTNRIWHLSDANGDGRGDACMSFDYVNAGWFSCALSKGDGSFAPSDSSQVTTTGNYSSWTNRTKLAMDMTGDGSVDACMGFDYTGNGWISCASADSGNGKLESVTNPLGGTTTVAYTPSSEWINQTLPMVLQTVSAITTDDGRGNTATTSYAYEGGLWDAEQRRFLGFRKATTTLPCIAGETQCPYSETTFRQDRASAGRVEQADRFDGAGTLLTRGLEEYVVNDTTAPYTALNTASESHIIVGAVTRRTRVTREFDDYANVVLETAHGDADVLGDEITAATDYSPDTTDYIVSLPARIRSFEGTGTTGTLLTESRILYDNATDWTTPPVRGDPTETQDWLDTATGFIVSSAVYDQYGNLKVAIDPLGRRTEIDYETGFNLYPIAQRNPLFFPPSSDGRHQTSTQWDTVCGVPTVVTDLNGNDTTTQYDALCRPIRTDLPDGGFTITTYNSLGDPGLQYVETQTPPADGSGNVWSRTYMDGFGRPYRGTAKGPAVGQDIIVDTAYDDRGNVASQTAPYYSGDPVYTTTFDYDALDRPVATNHPDGNWTQTDYGVAGVFVSTTSHDELGHPVTLHLDAFGRAVRKEEPLGAATVKTDYAYDALGRLTGIADDVGNTWAYTHDNLGRTLTVDDPDLGVWTKTYDNAGQLLTQTDALGQVTRFTYDALGRVATKTARDGTAQSELTTYTYDEAVAGFHNVGLLTRAENPSGILRYRYDELGRETQRIYTIDGSDYTLASGFDIAGRLIWQDYPDGDAVGSALDPITYDAAGRLDAVPGLVTAATYDASGNADVFTRANGVVSDYGYSLTRGWLASVVTTSGATSIQNMIYGRDQAGQITGITSTFTDESWTYGYDALRRLLTATNTNNAAHSRTYTYDSIGNVLTNSGVTGTYSYPAAGSPRPHAVTSVGSWTYTYDANGNMLTGAGRTYTYNGENRPTQIDTQAYTYGPDGERWKTVDSAPGGGTTLYLGGSIELAAGVMTKYLPGSAKRVGSPGDPLVETFWLHHDHQGSIQAITDAAGTEVQRFTYYPYGDRIATATAHEESKGWIGERQDTTGLFYLHARYYDPVIGRFVSADPSDPMQPGVGLNRYAYASNAPIMRVDPWGLKSSEEIDHYVERNQQRNTDRWGDHKGGWKQERNDDGSIKRYGNWNYEIRHPRGDGRMRDPVTGELYHPIELRNQINDIVSHLPHFSSIINSTGYSEVNYWPAQYIGPDVGFDYNSVVIPAGGSRTVYLEFPGQPFEARFRVTNIDNNFFGNVMMFFDRLVLETTATAYAGPSRIRETHRGGVVVYRESVYQGQSIDKLLYIPFQRELSGNTTGGRLGIYVWNDSPAKIIFEINILPKDEA